MYDDNNYICIRKIYLNEITYKQFKNQSAFTEINKLENLVQKCRPSAYAGVHQNNLFKTNSPTSPNKKYIKNTRREDCRLNISLRKNALFML